METLFALGSRKKTQALSRRLGRRVTHIRGVADLASRLESKEKGRLVIVDAASLTDEVVRVVGQLGGKLHGDPVLVADLANFDPASLCRALAAAPEDTPSRQRGPLRLHPELHNPDSDRIDARRVASFFGLSLARLAKALGRSAQSVHKTPDAERLQERLGLFFRIASALSALIGSAENARIWLNTPNHDLDAARPLELIERGKGDVVAELLEDALLGHPG